MTKNLIAALLLGTVQLFGQGIAGELIPIPGGSHTVLLYWEPAAKARGTVLMFPGGDGGLDMQADQPASQNFLVRTRGLWLARGYNVALFGNVVTDRNSDEHAGDIRAVLALLQNQAGTPIYIVGTSRGTHSAVRAAQLAQGMPVGALVLTSTMADLGSRFSRYDVSSFKGPLLVLSHRDDGCPQTSPAAGPDILDRATAASRKAFITVSGGRSSGNPCKAMAYHGFNGIEAQVVNWIADWLESPP